MALKREGVGDSMFSTSLRRRKICKGAVRYLKLLYSVYSGTKRAIPSALASHQRAPSQQSDGFLANGKIYDPLGLVSPITLSGKFLYHDICYAKLAGDAKLPSNLMQSWVCWEKTLPSHVTIPRSLAAHQADIQAIELHAFDDACGKGVAAAVYAVGVQEKGANQGLVASRARFAKKGLTIPWLELGVWPHGGESPVKCE